jgi:site-specific DNA-cytosine methylase
MQGFGDNKETGVVSPCKQRDHKDATDLICAVDCRNGVENPDTNGTLQAKSNGGMSLNLQNVVRTNQTVRRLTPLECERLQGYPTVKEWDVDTMTKDEFIALNLSLRNIIADTENGIIFRTRGSGGRKLEKPQKIEGTDVNGYLTVKLCCSGMKMQCRIHRIIWIAAHGIIPDGYCVDHINNNKKDNRLENLQLLTPEQNSRKAKEDGLYLIGEENPATKLAPELHDEIVYLYRCTDITQRELAEIYGISKSRINQIIKESPWTDIGEWVDSKGKKHISSDSARYKALGNSIALPPWRYVLGKLIPYCKEKTMASLFDGIGGFPLIWGELGGETLWASEIEEFPIAVTKRRFGTV